MSIVYHKFYKLLISVYLTIGFICYTFDILAIIAYVLYSSIYEYIGVDEV